MYFRHLLAFGAHNKFQHNGVHLQPPFSNQDQMRALPPFHKQFVMSLDETIQTLNILGCYFQYSLPLRLYQALLPVQGHLAPLHVHHLRHHNHHLHLRLRR